MAGTYSKKKRGLARRTETPAFVGWFLERATRERIRKLLPRRYHIRLRIYFEKYGCISCHLKNREYCASGICRACYAKIGDRLAAIDTKLKRQFEAEDDGAAKIFLERLESAKRLLGDLRAIMEDQPFRGHRPPW